ncbi:hypothetical protein [Pseudomonas sp. NBRC 111117]|uniref:hypothetical protein n=1 Tax=Pseudomonas sp. NBRC 111117 TaxID=1661032 RepID=UPI0006D45B2B|nr:hypothetical protein [Pseudomonas sp. NBRC 111117]
MPTENRSSNTEQMVSVPRSLLEEACNGLRITQDRARKELRALLAQPSTQHQGEPVAWVIFDNGFIDDHTTDKDLADGWREQGLEVSALYTHPDAGEVERLHNGHVKSLEALNQQSEKQRDHWIDECKTLRAQLAERDALLRRCLLAVREQHCDEGEADFDLPLPLMSDIDAALSASAEPKCQDGGMCADSSHKCTGCARDERDERALFESAHVAKCFNFNRKTVLGMLGEYGNPYVQSTWEGWQARAALERKP